MTPTDFDRRRQQMLKELEGLWKVRQDVPSWVELDKKLPKAVQRQMEELPTEIGRLRSSELQVAFVGNFNAGKSSLVNALLGRPLLPEAGKVCTAVPTHVRRLAASDPSGDHIVLHWLDDEQLAELDMLFRQALSDEIAGNDSLADLPERDFLKQATEASSRGFATELLQSYQTFLAGRGDYIGSRAAERRSVDALAQIAADESTAVYLDRVEVFVSSELVPEDVTFVDLPGLGVSNPRHRRITEEFIANRAHAVVFVMSAAASFGGPEKRAIEVVARAQSQSGKRLFFALNKWDTISDQARRDAIETFRVETQQLKDVRDPYTANALAGLAIPLLRRAMDAPSFDDAVADYPESIRETVAAMRSGYDPAAADEQLTQTNIPKLRNDLERFLSDDLRQGVLDSASAYARSNLAGPLRPILEAELQRIRKLADEGLSDQAKAEIRELLTEAVREAQAKLKGGIDQIVKDIMNDGPEAFAKASHALLEKVRAAIETGDETDCTTIRDQIVGRHLRKECFFLEIEMKVVSRLNALAKHRFIDEMSLAVKALLDEYIGRLQEITVQLMVDVEQDPNVQKPFEDAERKLRQSAADRVAGLVEDRGVSLDELLTFKNPNPGMLERIGVCRPTMRPMLEKLHNLAREAAGREDANGASSQGLAVQTELENRTTEIRRILRTDYVDACEEFEREVRTKAPGLLKNAIRVYEGEMETNLDSVYADARERLINDVVSGGLERRRSELRRNTDQLRNLIDRLDKHEDRIRGSEFGDESRVTTSDAATGTAAGVNAAGVNAGVTSGAALQR